MQNKIVVLFVIALIVAGYIFLINRKPKQENQTMSAQNDVSSPSNAFQVTPDDSEDLPHNSRAIYVGGQGDLRVLTAAGDEVTYKDLIGSKVLQVRKIFATDTTATDIVVEY